MELIEKTIKSGMLGNLIGGISKMLSIVSLKHSTAVYRNESLTDEQDIIAYI